VSGFLSSLLLLALTVVKFVIVVGLLLALVRVAFGHHGAHRQVLWAVAAFLVVSLWETGELGRVVHGVTAQLSNAQSSDWPFSVQVTSEGR
jgi:hypothetical protein